MKKIDIQKIGIPIKKTKKGYRLKLCGEVEIKEEDIKNEKVNREVIKFLLMVLKERLDDEIMDKFKKLK